MQILYLLYFSFKILDDENSLQGQRKSLFKAVLLFPLQHVTL